MNENQNNDEKMNPKIAPSLKEQLPSSELEEIPLSSTKEKKFPIFRKMKWEAPYPPPDMLEKYEKIQPGFTNALLNLLKEKSQQNFDLNNKLIDKHYHTQQLGQLFGFLSISFVIIGGVLVSIFGHPISGSTLSLGGLAALGGAFMLNYKFKKKKKKK